MAWNTTCRASAGKPCRRRAKIDSEQRDRRSLTWRDTENFRLNVTPSILISSTWVKPETVTGDTIALVRFLQLTNIISNDLEVFNLRLLLHTHVSMLLISAEHDLTLVAKMIKYVSSAYYFNIKLPCVTECKTDAVTTYEAGPITKPWMMLAVIARNSRLLTAMFCAVEAVSEKWFSSIIDVIKKIEVRELLEDSTVPHTFESFREVNG